VLHATAPTPACSQDLAKPAKGQHISWYACAPTCLASARNARRTGVAPDTPHTLAMDDGLVGALGLEDGSAPDPKVQANLVKPRSIPCQTWSKLALLACLQWSIFALMACSQA
jgi:hypothetical protein